MKETIWDELHNDLGGGRQDLTNHKRSSEREQEPEYQLKENQLEGSSTSGLSEEDRDGGI